jgi:Ca2+-binding EF-hand superfamily protein
MMAGNPLPSDFLFSHYLSEVLGKTIAEMVEIPFSVWCSVLCLFIVIWAVAGAPNTTIVASLFTMINWLLLGVAVAIFLKLRSIYRALVPEIIGGDATLHHASSNSINLHMEMPDEERLLMPQTVSNPPYMSHKQTTGCFKANKHESLFWFGKHGPTLILRALSALMFLNSLMMAVYGVYMAQYVWLDIDSVAVRFVIYIFAAVPLLLTTIIFIPLNVKYFVIASKVEMMKHQKSIKKTLLEMRTKKILRTIRLLHSLRMSIIGEDEGEGEEGKGKEEGHHHHDHHRHHTQKQLPEEKVEEAREVFTQYSGSDGHVDSEELGEMLISMGLRVTDEEAKEILKKIDKDNSNSICFDEFLSYLTSVINVQKKGPLTEEDVEHIFKIFDRDGSGEVTIDDFQVCFESLGQPMSISELNSFVRELDLDDSGTISLEELVKFLEKYSSEM